MGIEKKTQSFRVDAEVIEAMKQIALEENRSLSNLIETVLKNFIEVRGRNSKDEKT